MKFTMRRQEKSDLIRQVTSWKRLNSYEIYYDKTRKKWPLNTGDCLIEVTSWAGLIVLVYNWSLYALIALNKMMSYVNAILYKI
jgi:hypothetical protein